MKSVTLLSMLFLFSCGRNNEVDFNITNNSKEPIDSLTITNYKDIVSCKNLTQKESESLRMSFSKNITKSDGNYYLKLYKNNKIIDTAFGYFSNGLPLSLKYNIEITERQITIKESANQ